MQGQGLSADPSPPLPHRPSPGLPQLQESARARAVSPCIHLAGWCPLPKPSWQPNSPSPCLNALQPLCPPALSLGLLSLAAPGAPHTQTFLHRLWSNKQMQAPTNHQTPSPRVTSQATWSETRAPAKHAPHTAPATLAPSAGYTRNCYCPPAKEQGGSPTGHQLAIPPMATKTT